MIDDAQLAGWLEASELALTAAEARGMLTGFMCAGSADPVRHWLAQLLPADLPGQDAARAGLESLGIMASAAFADPDCAFTLPLPDDGQPLIVRATALHDWVRGFLYAFGVIGTARGELSPDGQDILRDLLELTRLDLDALDGGVDREDDEAALTELSEYLRVAALLLHAERGATGTVADARAPETD